MTPEYRIGRDGRVYDVSGRTARARPRLPHILGPAVYFLAAPLVNLIKIGWTRHMVGSRIAELETISPIPVVLVALLRGDHRVEKLAHRAAAPHRRHGEWFTAEGALEAFIALSADHEVLQPWRGGR